MKATTGSNYPFLKKYQIIQVLYHLKSEYNAEDRDESMLLKDTPPTCFKLDKGAFNNYVCAYKVIDLFLLTYFVSIAPIDFFKSERDSSIGLFSLQIRLCLLNMLLEKYSNNKENFLLARNLWPISSIK